MPPAARCPRARPAVPAEGDCHVLLSLSIAAISIALFWMAAFTLWWQMHAWRTPETLAATRFESPEGAEGLSFSLLLPARHEQLVLEHTIERLRESRHDHFEIIVIVGHDDPETAAVAERPRPATRGAYASSWTSTTPRTSRRRSKHRPAVLPRRRRRCLRRRGPGPPRPARPCRPRLHRHGRRRRAGRCAAHQLPLQLVRVAQLPGVLLLVPQPAPPARRQGLHPLGGNTVFVRTDVLRAAAGWDQDCLAEDCDLGVRLSSAGKRVVVAYDADMVTREETPGTLHGAAEAAHPLEPGVPPGLPQEGLARTAHPRAADARPPHPHDPVHAGVHEGS